MPGLHDRSGAFVALYLRDRDARGAATEFKMRSMVMRVPAISGMSLRTSRAMSTSSGRFVNDENATIRVRHPSSSRMFVGTREAIWASTSSSARVDTFQLHLLAQDRDAGLEVGRLDVDGQTRLETRAKAVFEGSQRSRRTVRRDDDLLAGLVEGIERMEELLLRLLFVLQELDVVYEKHVVLTVPVLEALDAVVPQRVDEVVRKRLDCYELDGQSRR